MVHPLSKSLEPRRTLVLLLMGGGLVSAFAYTVIFACIGRWNAAILAATSLGTTLAIAAWVRRRPLHVEAQVLVMCFGVFAVVPANIYTLGGLGESGGFLVWILLPVIAAPVCLEGSKRWLVLVAALALLLAWLALDPHLPVGDPSLGSSGNRFYVLNLVFVGTIVSVAALAFLRRLEEERRALRTSESRLRATLHNAPYAIAIQDADGRYTFANEGFAALFNLGPSDVEGHTDDEIFAPDLARVLRERAERARGDQTTGECEEEYAIDGVERTLRSTRFCLSTDAARPDLCWIARDVTVRKRLQNEAARAERLQSVGTLAGGIAHDFNNILMAATGHLSLARAEAQGSPRLDTRLDKVERALQRATALTGQLLAFSRGGAPVREATSVVDTIRESAAFVMAGSRVRAEFDLPPGLPPAVADLSQVGRLVENLVLNAVQSMPEGGTIRISADVVQEDGSTPDLKKGNRYVRFRVEDHGVGISPEHLARVFEPYFTTRTGGRGLGLTTCHSIARSHEGTILAESKVGVGSIFTAFIPAADVPPPEPHPADPLNAWRKHFRVLVMDDEPTVREVLEGMLDHLGFRAVLAADGDAALQAWRTAHEEGQPFHVVLLDLTVRGGMGGVETLDRLRAIDPSVRAVAVSGYSDDPVMSIYSDHGFAGVLPKPFRMKDLDRVLGEVLAPPS
ncbi:MAG: response regulator [Deltaproteobacteria bacterium]|nr:response regulator [Deltaproteobacteria bacterium]